MQLLLEQESSKDENLDTTYQIKKIELHSQFKTTRSDLTLTQSEKNLELTQ